MKKRLFALGLALVMVCALVPVPVSAETTLTPVTDDDGVEWYELATAEELTAFRDLVNSGGATTANARLTADITFNENVLDENGELNEGETFTNTWTPSTYRNDHYYGIGTYNGRYKGTFDGQGHTISGLYQKNTVSGVTVHMGLFSCADGSSVIKNVTVADSYFYASTKNPGGYTSDARSAYVGGICGFSDGGTIEGCAVHAVIAHSNGTATVLLGGICGWVGNGTIQSCVATGTITDAQATSSDGNTKAGGICGQAWLEGAIRNCASLMDITLETNNQVYAGGIIGSVHGNGVVNSCYNGGNVHGGGAVAGTWTENTSNSYGVGSLVGVVKVSNNYYLDGTAAPDTQGMGDPVTRADTGRLCWLLNGGYAQQSEPVWRQNLDGAGKDAYPVPDATHAQVYRSASGYTNDPDEAEALATPAQDEDGFYELRTKEDLFWLAQTVNANEDAKQLFNARLMNDIVVNQNMRKADGSLNPSDDFERWVPMGHMTGTGWNVICYPYSGVFDGNGHSISGLLVRGHGLENVGFLAWGGNGEIKDLTIQDSYFHGYQMVGGIMGYGERLWKTDLTNCHVKDSSIQGFLYVGGLAGIFSKGDLSRCSNSASVTGCQYVGGLVGRIPSNSVPTSLTNCWNTGAVHGFTLLSSRNVLANSVAGVCGYADQGSSGSTEIRSCWNAGAVTSDTTDNYGSVAGALNGGAQMVNCAGISTAPGPAGTVVTPKGFAAGQAAWILNGGNDQMEDPVWYQNVDNGKTPDPLPVLDDTHGAVYKGFVSWSNFPAGSYYVPQDASGAYLIGNAEALYWFAQQVNQGGENLALSAKLTADIVLNEGVLNASGALNGTPELSWAPIGSGAAPYTGTFDGQGHTISGLYCNDRTNNIRMGLIGNLEGGTVKNVTVADSFFATYSRVGAIVGQLYGGVIENCHNAGSTVYGITDRDNRGVGGIVGYVSGVGAAITCCTNSGLIRAFTPSGIYVTPMGAGGIAGHVEEGAISYCINSGRVRSGGNTVGGIAGKLCADGATVNHCGNTGYITGYNHAGGLCGAVENGAELSACWTTDRGSTNGDYDEGAVVGSANGGIVSADCYYPETVGNVSGKGTAKPRAEFDDGTVCAAAGVHNAVDGVCAFCGGKDAITMTGTPGEWTITGDLVSLSRPLVLIGAKLAGGNEMKGLEFSLVFPSAAESTLTGGFDFASGKVFLLDPATLAPICASLK